MIRHFGDSKHSRPEYTKNKKTCEGFREASEARVPESEFLHNPCMAFYSSMSDIDSQFLTACKEGDMDMVKFLVSQGANIHSELYKRGPIETAVRFDRLEILKFLFDSGAKSPNLGTAMSRAASSGNLPIVKYLVDQKAPGKDRALVNACSSGKYYVVKFLLKIGAAMQRFNNAAMKMAVRGNYWDVIQLLKREKKRRVELCVENRFVYFFFTYREGFLAWRIDRWW